jgi:hypothetical protein
LREPAEQAEPAETQKPLRSRAASKVILSIPGTVKLHVLAKREAEGQTRFTPDKEQREASRLVKG